MSDDLVAKARAALDGMTPGEWFCDDYEEDDGAMTWCVHTKEDAPVVSAVCGIRHRPDARFIAFARWWVPAAADQIEALEAENARLRQVLQRIAATSQAMSADYICNGGESGHERTARIAFAALTPETDNE